MLRGLARPSAVLTRMSSPSRSTHTGVIWGVPSWEIVATLASTGESSKARALSLRVSLTCPPLVLRVPGPGAVAPGPISMPRGSRYPAGLGRRPGRGARRRRTDGERHTRRAGHDGRDRGAGRPVLGGPDGPIPPPLRHRRGPDAEVGRPGLRALKGGLGPGQRGAREARAGEGRAHRNGGPRGGGRPARRPLPA